MSTPLRFLFFGAGAIGTYIGGSLTLAGYPTVYIERPEVARELNTRGLRLKIGQDEHHIPTPHICGSLQAALAEGSFDFAFLAVKSFDTGAVLDSIRPCQAQMPVIISLQNGVENEAQLRQVLGDSQVIAGTVTSAVGRRNAGDIILERLRGMGISGAHPRTAELLSALNRASLNAEFIPSETSMKWSKILTNLTANATSAILNMTPAEIFADRTAYRIDLAQMREALTVMRAHQISVVNLPGVPVTLMAWVMRFLPASLSRLILSRAVGRGRGDKMPSFHIDLYAGRGKSEVEYLNGAVERFGKSKAIATPVNSTLTDILLRLTAGQIDRKTYDHHPAALWKMIKLSSPASNSDGQKG